MPIDTRIHADPDSIRTVAYWLDATLSAGVYTYSSAYHNFVPDAVQDKIPDGVKKTLKKIF